VAYIRRVKTKSGATAVQVVNKHGGRIVSLKHIGSARTQADLDSLLALAKDQLYRDQPSLFTETGSGLTLQLKQTVSRLLFQVLLGQYQALGFDVLGDEDFARLCIARMVEPTSKLDSLRVLMELGVTGLTKDQLYRCLQRIISLDYRLKLQRACLNAVTNQDLTLVLYDVTTLYFETQKDDDYRKSGLSKERRLEPQIVVGLLVDRTGFPLAVQSFEGNTAETKTILPVLEAFRAEYRLPPITVIADAAMMSLKNLQALAAAGYTYVVGSRLNKIPYAIAEYQLHQPLTDQQIVVDRRDDYRIVYQYKEKRAALDLRNIEKQLTKAKRIVAGKAPAHKSKFVLVKTKTKALNLKLIDKAYVLAGIKGYVTNLEAPDQQIIEAYHQLFQVEKSFRMAKSDLRARPIFHWKREAIEAHLTIVLAALAVGKKLEVKSGLSLKKLVRTLQPIRAGTVVLNGREYPASEVIPEDIHNLMQKLGLGH